MFLAQCPIRTRAGPNQLSTLPTLMPATCSTKWRRGRHAPERARHGRRASKLCATRHLAPCCSKTERLCVSLPPSLASAHPGALPPCARTPERGRHGCRRQASVPPLLPLLQPSCACIELSIGCTRDCTSSLASPSSLSAAGASSPLVPAGSSHRLLWPVVGPLHRCCAPLRVSAGPLWPWHRRSPPGRSPTG